MKTAVAETSAACFYEHVVPNLAAKQNERVMFVINEGRDYSLCELMRLTNTIYTRAAGMPDIDKSSMARCVNGLRAAKRLEPAPERKCSISGITIIPSRLPTKQLPLIPNSPASGQSCSDLAQSEEA